LVRLQMLWRVYVYWMEFNQAEIFEPQ